MTMDVTQRQLNLLIDLDAARDTLDTDGDPVQMFQQLTRLLKTHFAADACAILLVDTTTGKTEEIIALGMPRNMADALGHDALSYEEPQPLESSAWTHTLGVQIVIDTADQIAGAIVLAHDDVPFSDDDIQLLITAETQLDSAVTQARTIYRLAERNRELEAIYQIDRLRDDATDETTLLDSFVSLLLRHFDADYCQIILRDAQTETMRPHSITNNIGLDDSVIQVLQELPRDIQTTTLLDAPDVVPELAWMAAPFIIAGERLGSVLIGRDAPFSVNDTRLMVAIASQIDSAIAKTRTSLQLAHRTRELEAIYRIDHIRDQDTDFDSMLQAVLHELCDVVSSETGYIMLYSNDQELLEIKATTKESIINRPDYLDVIEAVSRETLHAESIVVENDLDGAIRSIIATPLILNDHIIGVFGAVNSHHPHGFTNDDARMVSAITSQVDTAIFERLERRRMRKVLRRSVDPKVLEALLKRADDSLLAGERVVLSVLFADLRGSTEWAERTRPEELVSMLNTFLSMMTDVIFKHGGTLDKFVGDEVIALFGSPIEMPDHALVAARAALEMQQVHQQVCDEFQTQGRELPPMGIGISSGEVIAGEFGPPIRTDFTAMGRVMNLGARLCSAADANEIIISEKTQQFIADDAETTPLEPITAKGIQQPVHAHKLLRIINPTT